MSLYTVSRLRGTPAKSLSSRSSSCTVSRLRGTPAKLLSGRSSSRNVSRRCGTPAKQSFRSAHALFY